MAYRLFIDEVGNADLNSSTDPNHQYLSLTGVIVNMDNYANELDFSFRRLKNSYFATDQVVFHRRDMLDGKAPFQALKDAALKERFNADLLAALRDLNYRVITIAIDKLAHKNRYGKWQFHSYHYCLTCLVERYVKWLNRYQGACGDVMAESRNRIEDEKLKESYKRFHKHGTRYENDRKRLDRLSSGELKLKKKTANENGLQLADLLASPSFRRMLCQRLGVPMTAPFGSQVAEILLTKYDSAGGPQGVDGYGCKWLP